MLQMEKLKACVDDMALIADKPVITKLKSISNFKTRKGLNAGVKVTLRSNMMYEFIDRLVNIALPRIKDFRVYPRARSITPAIILWGSKSI